MPDPAHIDWAAATRTMRRMIAARTYQCDAATIDDLTQEALVRLARVARKEEIRELEAMMHHVARLTVLDHITRMRRRRPQVELDDAVGLDDGATRAAAMVRAVATLLRFFEQEGLARCAELARAFLAGVDWAEVAATRTRTPEAVRKEWSRCAAAARQAIGSAGGLLSGWM